MNSISSKFVQYTHRDKQLQFGSFKMSHGALSKWKIVYKRQICFLEVCLQKSLLTKEYIALFYVGSCLRFKHHMEKWCHMKKCTYPKHVKKVPIQTPTKTKWKCGDCDHNFTKKNNYYRHCKNIYSKQVSNTKSKPE